MEEFFAQISTKITPITLLAALWSLPWKGVALWKAAEKKSKGWFISLLLINTVGFLDALYIFYFSKRDTSREKSDNK